MIFLIKEIGVVFTVKDYLIENPGVVDIFIPIKECSITNINKTIIINNWKSTHPGLWLACDDLSPG